MLYHYSNRKFIKILINYYIITLLNWQYHIIVYIKWYFIKGQLTFIRLIDLIYLLSNQIQTEFIMPLIIWDLLMRLNESKYVLKI